ncbi:MAG: zinc-binding dehydrogenase [Halobacteriales archaeon]
MSAHGRVVALAGEREVEVVEVVEEPPIDPAAALAEVVRTNVCGSELHFWRGEMKVPTGIVLGHEALLRLDTLGEGLETDSAGEPVAPGDLVAPVYFQPCGECAACRNGQFDACDLVRTTGEWMQPHQVPPHYRGTFATHYYLFPGQHFYKVPAGVSPEAAAGANCALSQVLFGLDTVGLRHDETVVVQGAGGLGLAASAVATAAGAEVILVERAPERLERAEAFGADHLVDMREYETPGERARRVQELTDGAGADVGVEVAGVPEAFVEGPELLRSGGRYLEVGNISPGLEAPFEPASLTVNRIDVHAQLLYQPWYLRRALAFLERHGDRFPFDDLVDAEYPLEDAQTALEDSDERSVTRASLVLE